MRAFLSMQEYKNPKFLNWIIVVKEYHLIVTKVLFCFSFFFPVFFLGLLLVFVLGCVMHQLKLEVQIWIESCGISSDFNPTLIWVIFLLSFITNNAAATPNHSILVTMLPTILLPFCHPQHHLRHPNSLSSPFSSVSDNPSNNYSLHIVINKNEPIVPFVAFSPTTKTPLCQSQVPFGQNSFASSPHTRPHLGQSQFSTKFSIKSIQIMNGKGCLWKSIQIMNNLENNNRNLIEFFF